MAEARDGDDAARARLFERAEFDAGVKPQLIGLFIVVLILRAIDERCLHAQRAACDLEPREPRALRVARDLEDLCAEFLRIDRPAREARERGEKGLHAVQLERRTEKAGEDLAVFDHLSNQSVVDFSTLQKLLERRLVAEGERFIARFLRCGEIDAFRAQCRRELAQKHVLVRAHQVHLVDEKKRRHLVAREQAPERSRVALHAVAAADDEHCVVEHRQRALHLGGEIDVARRVKQRELLIARKQHCLLGKDRDAALALELVGVEEGVAVVDAAELPQCAGGV